MSFNFVSDMANVKNNFSAGANGAARVSLTQSNSLSIFMQTETANVNSASIFTQAKSTDEISAKSAPLISTQVVNNTGFFDKIVSFFGNEKSKTNESTLLDAQATLQSAKSLTSSATSQALLEKAEKGEDAQENSKGLQLTNEDNATEKDDENKNDGVDYSKMSRTDLMSAFLQGKPSNPQEAIQMLKNTSLPAQYFAKIQQKFPNDKEIADLIGELKANVQ